MEITAEVLQTAITTNPEVVSVITSVLEGSGFVAVKKDSYDQLINEQVELKGKEKASVIYSRFDNDIKQLAGFEKEPNEQTHVYLKRAIDTYKSKATELEQKIASGQIDQVTKDRMAELERQLNESKEQLSAKDQAIFKREIEKDIALGKAGIKFKAGIPEIAINAVVKEISEEIFKGAKRQDNGEVYFVDKDGKTMFEPTLNRPKTAQEIIKERLAEFAEEAQDPKTGTGIKPPKTGTTTDILTKDGTPFVIPDGVRTKMQLTEELIKAGISVNSAEFSKVHATEFAKKLPLR